MTLLNVIRRHFKQILIVVALSLPILILTSLFLNQSLKAIDFTQSERRGASYLQPTWETLSHLFRNQPPPILPLTSGTVDNRLGLSSAYNDVSLALKSKPFARETEDRLQLYLVDISDTYNLTLDPHIDTYYLMNTVVSVLPAIGEHAAAIHRDLQLLRYGHASDLQKADLNTESVLLQQAMKNLERSQANVIHGNSHGKVATEISRSLKDFQATYQTFSAQTTPLTARVLEGRPIPDDKIADLDHGTANFLDATDILWRDSDHKLAYLLETRIQDDQGRLWWLLGLATLVSLAALGIVTYLDLTVQHEHILRLNTVLQAQNLELERFAFVCSHDLQEPVRMTNVYAGLLSLSNDGALGPDAEHYIQVIRQNAARMQKMIQDILTFSRVGREAIKEDWVDCASVLKFVLDELSATITEKSAKIAVTSLPILRSNHTLVLLLFQNLVSNALKFSEAGRPPEVTISSAREGAFWRIDVQDNGIGIEPEYSDRIFTLFQRLNRNDDYPGSGIGLSTCKKFVQLCGGDIGFTSKPGLGTVFSFRLPVKE